MSSARTSASPRRVRTQPTTVGWIAIILFVFLAGIGAIAAIAAIGVYNSLASDLKPPSALTTYVLPQESIIYDRTGKIELARFGDAKREVVTFDQIPKVLLDATTAVEDKTFWDNAGFDPVAIFSAALGSLRGDSRGASTITQQLVRARLLDPALVQDPHRTAERKLKEIIQSIRITEAFPGEKGKQDIITAYLNQNYYGNQSYGVKAAAKSYFGIDLSQIDPAQAAILAGLPKSPSIYDLVRNATETCQTVVAEGADCPKGDLIVDPTSQILLRRNAILDLLAAGRTPMSGTQFSPSDFASAKNEQVKLANQVAPRWIAPHFVWAVRDELATKLCGADTPTCTALDNGGFRVTTTLDANLQRIAEKWVKATALVPHAKDPTAAAKALGFKSLPAWMANLRSKQLRNSALVAVDYTTGELVAYVGSADYYATSTKPAFQPQYDVAGKGFRQPGSAFKPINYAVAINDKKVTAGTMLMDVGTDFGGTPTYKPSDADNLERGPVRVRTALQFSLNIPAVKTMALNGPDHVLTEAQKFGLNFAGPPTAGLALALGVKEVRPVDLATGYGTIANGGKEIPHTTILTIKDSSGNDAVPAYVPPAGTQAVSPQAAYIVTDILAGNTNKNINPFWGKFSITGPDRRRPATLKTGTNNDAKDLNAYGFIAPPTDAGRTAGAYALAVGVWDGNSDNSLVSTASAPLFSIDVATYEWQGFLQEASAKWPVTDFTPPADGLVQAKIDPFTGLLATGSTRNPVTEWFLSGPSPPAVSPPTPAGSMSSTASRSRPVSPRGWQPTATGWPAPRRVPARWAGQPATGRPTSTTAPSTRTGPRGAPSSVAVARPPYRRRPASRSRHPMPVAWSRRSPSRRHRARGRPRSLARLASPTASPSVAPSIEPSLLPSLPPPPTATPTPDVTPKPTPIPPTPTPTPAVSVPPAPAVSAPPPAPS